MRVWGGAEIFVAPGRGVNCFFRKFMLFCLLSDLLRATLAQMRHNWKQFDWARLYCRVMNLFALPGLAAAIGFGPAALRTLGLGRA